MLTLHFLLHLKHQIAENVGQFNFTEKLQFSLNIGDFDEVIFFAFFFDIFLTIDLHIDDNSPFLWFYIRSEIFNQIIGGCYVFKIIFNGFFNGRSFIGA